MQRGRVLIVASFGVALGAALALHSCNRDTSGSGIKVIVIGLDGANTKVISPLLAAGRMPNLKRFLDGAGGGHLDSPVHLGWTSPALWTSIVTGVRPECHGVTDFVCPAEDAHGAITVRDPNDPTKLLPFLIAAQSSHRRVKALWNVLDENGLASGILGLWATWPAEQVRGAIVTDYVPLSRVRLSKEFRVNGQIVPLASEKTWGLVHPLEWTHDVNELVRLPDQLEPDVLRRFADFTDEEIEKILKGEFVGSLNTGTDPFQELKTQVQSDRSFAEIAELVDGRANPDLLFVYLEGIDVIEHHFFGHYAGAADVPADERTRYQDLLNRYHEFTDELIAPWLAKASEDTVVIIVSDHGFALRDDDPKHPRGWHDRNAIFFAAGGPIRRGAEIDAKDGATTGRLVDVAPTVLALLGMPVAENLEGRVLEELLEPSFLTEHPVREVKSFGPRVRDRLPSEGSDVDDALITRLKALGYLGGAGGNSSGAAGGTEPEARPLKTKADVDCRGGATMAGDVAGDLLVHGGSVVLPSGVVLADVLIVKGKVSRVSVGRAAPRDCPTLDATGKLVFPGLIDPQVHFREPGLEHKEDLASGSEAAIAGGVTAFMEMPNTRPPTTDPERLADKLARAKGRVASDHSFFLGATAENAEKLGEWEQLPGCAGVKVFMGSSTGDLLVPDDPTLERVLRSGTKRVAVHAEDEPRLKQRYAELKPEATVLEHPDVRDVECALRATTRLLDLAEKTGRKVHVLHVSTAEEIALIRERGLGELVTCEVTPNHLFLAAPECYLRWGTRAQMNPPVRDARHRDVLREALADGTIACIGSDHAPHTLEEKSRAYPASPSGIPGVQTILPLLLTAVRDGWLRMEDVPRICTVGPIRVYPLADKGALEIGKDGDLVVVDPAINGPLPIEWLKSRASWSPYVGVPLAGLPTVTVLRGKIAWQDGALVLPPRGRPLT